MTDKELLELAAKAAGIKGGFVEAFPEDGYPAYSCGIGTQASPLLLWNPLTDDGDALRLALDLSMSVDISDYEKSTYVYAGTVPRVHVWENWGDNKHAATRRAIVRAAAAIGKDMP